MAIVARSVIPLVAGMAILAACVPNGQTRTPDPTGGSSASHPSDSATVSPFPRSDRGGDVARAEARRLSEAFVTVAERVSPSVVQLDVTSRKQRDPSSWMGGDEGSPISRGMGSGVIFTEDGAILTNNHVVDEALSISVRLRDGRFLPAKLLGRDPATDLAVVKVDARGLVAATLADSDTIRVGEWTVAIGSPFGLGYTVTAGVLSAKGRGGLGVNLIEDYLQTDASINPGNSGGPLCDLEGRVVGINTMIVGRASGIGFAVPMNLAARVGRQILSTGRVRRAWMGVGVQDLGAELGLSLGLSPRAGALVNNVAEGGPAFLANIRPGDVIAKVAGKPVHDAHDLIRETISHDVGTSIRLEVIRQGARYQADVKLAERKDPPVPLAPVQQVVQHPGFGIDVRDLHPDDAERRGLPHRPVAVIHSVVPGSAADRAGLRAWDIIVEANNRSHPTAAELRQLAATGQIVLRVRRRDAFFYAAVRK